MSDYGYHQARMMTTDDIQLVQFHYPVPAHLSSVLHYPGQVSESAELIPACSELSALSTMEAYLCSNIAGRDSGDVLFGLSDHESEAPQMDGDSWCAAGIVSSNILQVLQLHQ